MNPVYLAREKHVFVCLSLALCNQQGCPGLLPYLSIRGEAIQMLKAFYCPFGHGAEFAVGILTPGDDAPSAGIVVLQFHLVWLSVSKG